MKIPPFHIPFVKLWSKVIRTLVTLKDTDVNFFTTKTGSRSFSNRRCLVYYTTARGHPFVCCPFVNRPTLLRKEEVYVQIKRRTLFDVNKLRHRLSKYHKQVYE